MPRIPLFTQQELAAAFALIFPAARAQAVAADWFERFAGPDQTDSDGFFLYQDWRDAVTIGPEARQSQAVAWGPAVTQAPNDDLANWRGWSESEKISLVMRLSGFHFALLSLVSDELFERVRRAQDLTTPQAERAREQMRRIAGVLLGGDS